ncbi:MAG TPA: hypothetical protein VGM44_24895, partial [Polyangiaceae bacterium]
MRVGLFWVARVSAVLVVLGSIGCSSKSDSGGAGGGAAPGTATETLIDTFITGVVPNPALCLPTMLPVASDSSAACIVFAAANTGGTCACSGAGRSPVDATVVSRVTFQLELEGACGFESGVDCASFCVCEVAPAEGPNRDDCVNSVTPAASTTGWCYVAPADGIGSIDVVADCPDGQQERLRLLGDAQPVAGESLFLACGGGAPPTVRAEHVTPAALGSVCISSAEYDPSFPGFQIHDVSLDVGTVACDSNICLQNHFQGRVSCPYGQQVGSANGCHIPGTADPVTLAEVEAEDVGRPPADASFCSCRCAGPGAGPFCSCASGMECVELIPDFGIESDANNAGSYCIPKDSEFSETDP